MNDEQKLLLKKYENTIKKEIPYVDVKPYSTNIICLTLQMIDNLKIENITAKNIITKYKLNKLGFT
tara:strand:+ start:1546 stop:1743 length:198 start_codon:yes stop_codon:yes gene_type:complete